MKIEWDQDWESARHGRGCLSGWGLAWKVVCLASTQKAERPSALVCLHTCSARLQLSHSARSIFAFRCTNLGSFQAGGGAFTASEILWDMVRSCLDDGQGYIMCVACWKAGKKKADPACLLQDLTGFEIIKATLSLRLSSCLSFPQNGDTDDAPEPLCPIYRRAVRENDTRQIYLEPDSRASAILLGDDTATEARLVELEMDDEAVQQLMRTSRRVEEEGEEVTVHHLAPDIIPAMKLLPDKRLALNADQLWSNSVPIPLDRTFERTHPHCLNRNQIWLLDILGQPLCANSL
ncbi:uncharacterized protein Z520_12270 [Fonsecaea multimorphosa CBS 102226]|uniref:Uncharacterized protein n=1 Tax=Fonsecaea multimorphosa CBS 102226 TaxID=1442371 RepID=A0A0D2JNE1_9EURO|nr:uncharacterized protein Z520_12270 [Fonsecaea multimorphosa CBS 102226]KIX91999.1 hypothetical protein Z520_12270 [Fonsecaea multimorphosa CBS 102226]